MSLTVYLAGPYAAREQLAIYATELAEIGYHIRCRWLRETHDITPGTAGAAAALDDVTVHGHARMDLEDIGGSEVVVAFTADVLGLEQPVLGCVGHSGGRHVETGYALALGKHVVLVGEPENVFHRLREVERHPDWHTALVALAGRLVAHEQCAPPVLEVAG